MASVPEPNAPPRGYIDPDFPNPMGPNDATIIIYGYTPSLALAVLGIVLFTLASAAHLFLLIRRRTWYFSPILVGSIMEIIGYTFRLLSSQNDPYSVPWFVVQYFFIVVAPVFFSAAIYTLVSVLITISSDRHRDIAPFRLTPKIVLWTFITCDVVATIIQIAGAALVGSAYSSRSRDPATYNKILLAGLAFQVFSFALFLVVLAGTLFKVLPQQQQQQQRDVVVKRSFICALVVATLAVYLRTCFRLAETAEGLLQELSTHEVYFGCLEFAPIVVAVYIFVYWHPGRWLNKPTSSTAAAQAADDLGTPRPNEKLTT